MEETSPLTKQKIQAAALAEFLDKGFLGASLRQIVKNAGVTTGAFYGYFSSKEALFASIVEPHAAALMGRFMEAQTSFAEQARALNAGFIAKNSKTLLQELSDFIDAEFAFGDFLFKDLAKGEEIGRDQPRHQRHHDGEDNLLPLPGPLP